MKIVQLTDLHLRGDDLLSFGVADTVEQVKNTMEYFNQMKNLPDFFVVSGDLADNGDLDAYHNLKEHLTQLPRPVYVLPGNQIEKRSIRYCRNT